LVKSSCNSLIENYTETFYSICKRNVPSFQCKGSLNWFNSMGEVDCLNLLFSNSYVQALTLGLNWIKPSLDFPYILSQKISAISKQSYVKASFLCCIIYIQVYSVGYRTESYGIPAYNSLGMGISHSMENLIFFLRKRELISLIKLVENLYSKPCCHTVWKVYSISKNAAAIGISLLKLKVTWSFSFVYCSVVLWFARNPNWLALSNFLPLMCLWVILRKASSESLPLIYNNLTERRIVVDLWSLPGFVKVIIFASFQDSGDTKD
jgi:hypothetical protein